MKVKITMTGGAVREADSSGVVYDDKFAVLDGWFFCPEKNYCQFLHLRLIHIDNIEYIKQ